MSPIGTWRTPSDARLWSARRRITEIDDRPALAHGARRTLQHFRLDPLHGASPNAEHSRSLQHAGSLRQLSPCLALDFRRHLAPPELHAPGLRSCQPRVDAFPDNRSLELSERARDVEQQAP